MSATQPASVAAITVACSVPGLFGFFCPGVLDAPSHDLARVRQQQAKGAAASLALGAAGSAVSKTPWPFLISIAMVGLLMWEYESAAKRPEGSS